MEEKHTIAPVLIEIRPSKMLPGEIGLFAAQDLKKDTIIAKTKDFVEIFHPWEDFEKLDKHTQRKIEQYCIQTKEGFYTPEDFNWLPVPWNMNHCCNYNVGFDEEDNFVTSRDVERGEELCWDYGMGISDDSFRLECKCGSENCRKIITGNDWKDEEYRKKNAKYFSRRLLAAVKLNANE